MNSRWSSADCSAPVSSERTPAGPPIAPGSSGCTPKSGLDKRDQGTAGRTLRSGPTRVRRLSPLALLGVASAILPVQAANNLFDLLDARGSDEIRIQEIFTSHLPDTIAESSIRASLHPRFGDLFNRDYFRASTGLRYGATSRLEVSAGADLYFSHGAGDVGFFDDAGIHGVRFGAKFNAYRDVLSGWETGVGFDTDIPVGTPPPELTDGLKHFTPYVTFSRRLPSRPSMRVFWGAGFDFVEPTTFPGVLATNQLDDDSLRFTAGFVIDRGRFHYTFETRYSTTHVVGNTDEDVLELRPAVIWEVPSFRDRTRWSGWLVGVGGKASFGPDGTDTGISGKLRYNFDLKGLFRRGSSGNQGN